MPTAILTTPTDFPPTPPPSENASRERKREWNRGPLSDFFPRVPTATKERLLDILIDKGVTYNLSQSKHWNARRFTSIVVAHVRHQYSDYDRLLREEKVERFEARRRTADRVWKVLRAWCPWDTSNDVLERCFKATLIRPEERDDTWDPMDIDIDSDDDDDDDDFVEDPMDLD